MPAIDVRNLRPVDVCRLLNSTPLGPVLDERKLYRHRTRAGFRFSDGRHIDLFRYAAWLVELRHTPRPQATEDPYAVMKERARARNAALALAGRDIGELPDIANPGRRALAAGDFRYFCESYFPSTFHLPWSPDHLKVIAKIEQAVLHGGLFAMAMPRGSGKTSKCECACIWAVLYGHRDFVCLVGSDEGHAMDMLDSIKTELDGNDLLLADFPEVCYPIQSLDGIANRCAGQLYRGERTHIGWTAKDIVLPTIKPVGWLENEQLRLFVRPDGHSMASGAIIKVAGITGRIRGMKSKASDGRSIRPSLVVIDDPQTDEAARSLSQCATRESILAGAILGLAGPGKKIAGVMPCTVIRPGDMADNILDRHKHPEWNGERTKMVYSFPSNEKLWSRYAEIRAESLRAERGLLDATEFYHQNRSQMDEGAVVAWPERFNHDELSAIQHAMNLKLQDERAFWAEYQNEPLPEDTAPQDDLTADQIAGKLNRMGRGEVPLGCSQLTMFIDVQQNLLFYVVAAWQEDFTGYIIDYGAYPDQRRPYFTIRDAQPTLSQVARGTGLEGAIYVALELLTAQHLGREWRRDDGALMRIRALSDRRQLGPVDRRGLSVLPSKCTCGRAPAQPRSLCRGFKPSVFGIQAKDGRPRRSQLAHPQRAGQAGRAPRRLRHKLLEVVHLRAAVSADGRQGLPVTLWRSARAASSVCGASYRRVSRADPGSWPDGRRVEAAAGNQRKPLVGLPGGLCCGSVNAGGCATRYCRRARAETSEDQVVAAAEKTRLVAESVTLVQLFVTCSLVPRQGNAGIPGRNLLRLATPVCVRRSRTT